jgi:hypothetical protein
MFEHKYYRDLGYETWKDFCIKALGPLELQPRAIDYLRTTHKKCDEAGIGKEIAGEIGWSKLKETIPVLTKENKDHWIDLARQEGMTVYSLRDEVQIDRGLMTREEAETKSKFVKVVLNFYPDQAKMWDLSMEVGFKVTASESKEHVVAGAMIPDFLATYAPGMEVPDKARIVANALTNIETTFKVKFMGDVVDETGEILVEGGRRNGRSKTL